MRLKEFDIDPVDVDADGICASQTPAAGGTQNLTLNGALVSGGVATLDYARQLVITAAGNETARTFTVTGTDPDGYALTEAITGPNATTVESAEYFATVTQISVDADTAGAITVGTVDEICSKTLPLDWRKQKAVTLNLDVTGTLDYTVQETFDEVLHHKPAQSAYANAQWRDVDLLADLAADQIGQATLGATAVRLVINSYSSTAEVQMNINHAGLR